MRYLLLVLLSLFWAIAAWAGPVNINTATLDELKSLPGIGDVKAQAILDDREQNGTYSDISELTRVKGIGDKTVMTLTPHLVLADGDTPPSMANMPKVDLNAATQAELETLPGIGPAKANAILEWRDQNGPFMDVSQLTSVKGIGDKTLSNLQHLVAVSGDGAPAPAGDSAAPEAAPAPKSSAVNINTASQAQLERLPNVGPTKAAAIIQAREGSGPFKSCQDLVKVKGIGPATLAKIGTMCTVE